MAPEYFTFENCERPVAKSSRPRSRAESSDDDLTRSLMEELLSSTRKSIGASDLFRNTADPPHVREDNFQPQANDTKKDLAWMLVLYLLGVIGSMIVAGFWFF